MMVVSSALDTHESPTVADVRELVEAVIFSGVPCGYSAAIAERLRTFAAIPVQDWPIPWGETHDIVSPHSQYGETPPPWWDLPRDGRYSDACATVER
jgi:hypothetical protein